MSITGPAGTLGGLPHAPRLKLRAAAGGEGERGEALGSGYDLWGFLTADKQMGILGKHASCEVERRGVLSSRELILNGSGLKVIQGQEV